MTNFNCVETCSLIILARHDLPFPYSLGPTFRMDEQPVVENLIFTGFKSGRLCDPNQMYTRKAYACTILSTTITIICFGF